MDSVRHLVEAQALPAGCQCGHWGLPLVVGVGGKPSSLRPTGVPPPKLLAQLADVTGTAVLSTCRAQVTAPRASTDQLVRVELLQQVALGIQ